MDKLRNYIVKYKSTNWLLVAAILLISLIPAHYHLHHICGTESTNQTQVIDLHLTSDTVDHSHHDVDTTIIKSTPDSRVQDSNSTQTLVALLTVFLILLVLVNLRISIRSHFDNIVLKQVLYYFAPPLRAPPQY